MGDALATLTEQLSELQDQQADVTSMQQESKDILEVLVTTVGKLVKSLKKQSGGHPQP